MKKQSSLNLHYLWKFRDYKLKFNNFCAVDFELNSTIDEPMLP